MFGSELRAHITDEGVLQNHEAHHLYEPHGTRLLNVFSPSKQGFGRDIFALHRYSSSIMALHNRIIKADRLTTFFVFLEAIDMVPRVLLMLKFYKLKKALGTFGWIGIA